MVVSRSVRFDESVTDTVDVDTDSETDEEVQTVPATEVKSVPVLARPSDCWRSISLRCDLMSRVTRMCVSCHIPLTCNLCDVAHFTCITHDVSNYTTLHVTCHITLHYTHVYNYTCQLALCWQRWHCCPVESVEVGSCLYKA